MRPVAGRAVTKDWSDACPVGSGDTAELATSQRCRPPNCSDGTALRVLRTRQTLDSKVATSAAPTALDSLTRLAVR